MPCDNANSKKITGKHARTSGHFPQVRRAQKSEGQIGRLGDYKTCYEPQSPLVECTGGYEQNCHMEPIYEEDCTTKTETIPKPGFQITCRGSSYCSLTSITGDQSNGCRTTGSCTIEETITSPPECEQVKIGEEEVCQRVKILLT